MIMSNMIHDVVLHSTASRGAARPCIAVARPPTTLLQPAGRRHVVPRYRSDAGGGHHHRDETLVLYTAADPELGGLAPDCHAVLLALLEKRMQFEEVKVNPTDDEFKELYQSILPDGGGRGVAPPLIVWGKHRLLQADVILEYLAAEPGDGVPPLLPPDPYAAARVRLFCSVFLSHVPPALHKVLLCEGKQARAEAEAALMTALAQVDAFLQLHGGFTEGESAVGPHHEFVMSPSETSPLGSAASPHEHFFLGPWFTLAEVRCTPYVARIVHTLPEWRGCDVIAECEARKLVHVAGWMRACLARPSAQQTAPSSRELVGGLVDWQMRHAM